MKREKKTFGTLCSTITLDSKKTEELLSSRQAVYRARRVFLLIYVLIWLGWGRKRDAFHVVVHPILL